MKYSKLFLCLLCFAAIELQAQLYTSEIEVTNNTNGKVGIGTTTPTSIFHIFQNTTLGSQYNPANAHLMFGNGIYDMLMDGNEIYTNNSLYLGAQIDIRFRHTTTAGSTDHMIIKQDGKVGIGTLTPTRILDVFGDGDTYTVDGTTVTGVSLFRNSTGRGIDIGTYSNGNPIIQTTYNETDLIFGTRDSGLNFERLRIKANGKVGIGTTNPSRLLHVSGGTGSAFLKLEADTDNSGETDNPRIEISQDGGLVQAYLGFNESIGGDANMFRIGVYNVGNYRWNAMVIKSENGYVGINTNTPGYQLDVNGTARVTTLIQSSDERLKKDIRAFSTEDKMNNLAVYKYKLKGELLSNENTSQVDGLPAINPSIANQSLTKDHIGLIAQEVELVYPDLVYTDGQGYKAIDYSQFIPILIDRTNKQEEKIKTLEERIAALEVLIKSKK